MRTAKAILGLAVLGLFPAAASGQSLRQLITRGDTVIGLGAMNLMTYVSINDSKVWMALLSTDFPDQNTNGCILSNGFVTVREGTRLLSPAGATLDEWTSIGLNNSGDLGMIVRVKPSSGPVFDGAYWNLIPVALKDQVVVSPFLGAGADWDTFSVVKLNARNEMFILGEIANPDVTRNRERSLVRYRLDSRGIVLDTTVLGTEGMTIPAGARLSGSACLGNDEHVLSVNDRGDFITFAAGDGNFSALLINMQTIVAQVGRPSPVGKDWRNLLLSRVAINDRGDWAVTGSVGQQNDPDSYVVIKNNQKVAQSNDIIPSLSPTSPLSTGSVAPLILANTGDLFWHARAANADAFMRNLEPVLQAGRSIVNGALVTSVSGSSNSFAISPNGRFFVGTVDLQTTGTTAVFADFGLVLELPGCRGNPGKLSLAAGKAILGTEFQLGMSAGQAPGAAATLFFSRQPRLSPAGCGIVIPPYGELMLSSPIVATLPLSSWDGTNPSLATIRVPNNVALVDAVFTGQGVFFSPNHPTERFRLTNAVRIEIGAP